MIEPDFDGWACANSSRSNVNVNMLRLIVGQPPLIDTDISPVFYYLHNHRI